MKIFNIWVVFAVAAALLIMGVVTAPAPQPGNQQQSPQGQAGGMGGNGSARPAGGPPSGGPGARPLPAQANDGNGTSQ